ncbi:ERF family protein [Paraburkholderia sp. C35]|uniref:ERF family protein n=1 Tax=Paraburkholderia sp. C35 TaxID=2126993 RepID=UPI00194FE22A|nr:ERF family protein [Paraburkholderia sp. C35]
MTNATMADVIDVESAEAPSAKLPAVQQEQPVAQTAVSVTTPGDLLRLAVQKGADIGMLERLLDLQQRFEEREAAKAFVAAMSAFKREPIEIYKRKGVGYHTKEGDFVGYKHAQLSDVTDAIAPAMARHGLSFGWDVQQQSNQITVHCVVTHQLGHSKTVTMVGAPDTSGKKNAIQQVASTVTYLQRYTLLAVTGMSTKDEDDDGQGSSDADQQQGQQQQPAQQTRAGESNDKPIYSDEKFNANKGDWKIVVTTGRKTPEKMISFIETRGSALTDAQKKEIRSWANADGNQGAQ